MYNGYLGNEKFFLISEGDHSSEWETNILN